MLSLVQGWFAPRCNPIGIDFGSDALRLSQVQWTGEEYKLIAAGTADVPTTVRNDPAARWNFFVETTRDLLAQGNFHGRQAVLALPASTMFVRHLRMPKLDDEAMKKALPWELRGKLPIDPSHAVLRHVIAGEVYQDQEPKYEVIVIAAARELVNQMLSAAARAKLDVVGMNIEPKALIDCFAHVHRRKSDQEMTTCFVDIGCTASRAVVARGGEMLFARTIPVGGDQFSRAVADALKINLQEAKILRAKLCGKQTSDEPREKRLVHAEPAEETGVEQAFALLSSGVAKHEKKTPLPNPSTSHGVPWDPTEYGEREATNQVPPPEAGRGSEENDDGSARVARACVEPLAKLIEELNLCRRYYESTFPERPIDRLIFVGGEARQRTLCQQVAREMGLAAQIGDPMVRIGRISEIGIESGIDRRLPQPSWAVSLGLSMGPRELAGAKVRRTMDESVNARG